MDNSKEIDITPKRLPVSSYYDLCRTLAEYKEAPTDDRDPDYLSDGEWLDVFYYLCIDLKNDIEKEDAKGEQE